MPPRLDLVRQPYALPPPPGAPFVVLDVAFAGASGLDQTLAFIEAAGDRLRLWVDHHEHAQGWPRFQGDERFVLVGSRIAHACPELVTPALVARAGDVKVVVAHHDFDGLVSAACFLRGGEEPYEGAHEDARAADSPGRGHVLGPKGERLVLAISEAGVELEDVAFTEFCRQFVASLVDGREDAAFARELDRLAEEARGVAGRARNLAVGRRVEAPGVCVVRLPAQVDGRMRRALLAVLEEEETVGLVLEGSDRRWWATAATYDDRVPLEEATELDRGRHDLRFGVTRDPAKLVQVLSRLAKKAEGG